MPGLAETFLSLRARHERALIPFVTAGDPSLDALPAVLEALADGGADVIEVGLPFSDPIADGPVIQASSHRALERGVTTRAVFDAVRGLSRVPLVLMGYMNPLLRMGLERFAQEAVLAGVSGVIVCDLTPDEAGPWLSAARSAGLDTVFLAAPTSTDERLEGVCRASSGFVYAVSRTGVTGSVEKPWDEASELVGRLRARTDLAVCVGFGVTSPEHVRQVCSFADGAIVGSKLVSLLAETWRDGQGRSEVVDFVRALKAATSPA